MGEPAAEPQTEARPAPVLALGFRPFFLLAGAMATTFIPLWLFVHFGKVTLPSRLYPASWHAHEMIFGFAVAVIAGFLLTAVRNWTNLPTPSGAPLGVLVALWLLGRVAVFFDVLLPRGVSAALDLTFIPAFAIAIAIPIVKSKNWRNLGFLPLLSLLFLANLAFHANGLWAARALRFSLAVIVAIIVVVGGRVIPMFTANALKLTVKKHRWLDWASLASVGVVAVLELVPPAEKVLAVAAIVAGALNGARMAGWQPLATRKTPILWVLHVGYAWLALGLVLQGGAVFVPQWIKTAPMHVTAVGAIATLILGMTTRVSLGHTGRMLAVPASIAFSYVVLTVAVVLRGVAPLIAPTIYMWLLIASGAAWALAFAIFTFVYLPILTTPRVDGKPG